LRARAFTTQPRLSSEIILESRRCPSRSAGRRIPCRWKHSTPICHRNVDRHRRRVCVPMFLAHAAVGEPNWSPYGRRELSNAAHRDTTAEASTIIAQNRAQWPSCPSSRLLSVFCERYWTITWIPLLKN